MVMACRGNILKRVLCLLLCFLLLFCFFVSPRAHAVALEAATVAYAGALVGTILVGAGVVFASHGDMQQVGAAMYKSWVKSSNAIGTKIRALASWAVEHGEAAAKGALRVGKDLYQGIIDAFNATYSDGKVSLGSDVVTLPTDATEDEIDAFCNLFANKDVKSFYLAENTGTASERVHHIYYTVSGSVYRMVVDNAYGGGSTDLYERTIGIGGDTFKNAYFQIVRGTGSFLMVTFFVETRKNTSYVQYASSSNWHLSVSLDPISVTVPQPDLKYPSDDYLVKMPDLPAVDETTGDVTYPSDAAYTKDAIAVSYPVDAEGVKVPDIPYDKVVDQSTGKALDDTGTDVDNPSKPGEDTDTKTDTDVNWPDVPSLSLPELIASKFPFCIPFDVARLVGLLEADAKAPVWRIPFKYSNIVDEEIVIDFDDFSAVIRVIRWGEIILFVAGLILVTRNYIKW